MSDEIEELQEQVKVLQADVRFLAVRADYAGRVSFRDGRDTGLSSNSLVAFAYGLCPPESIRMPCDHGDADACRRAFEALPEHRKTAAVHTQLERQLEAVGD